MHYVYTINLVYEEIDYIASENICYFTEEGLPTYPTKLIQEVSITDYDCVIIPGQLIH
ncbi:hypothetical protein CIRMBP1315_00626 [Enterococcus cecorum]|uniref:hypothetical protein n=1 Tax=Enterococcus cecorum TaxID=44008 RepID=UPI001F32A790|nr:hypothetical protein [Enterococcus cecorum]CAI3371842.1 hypothetical protein CIRMBP1315_00626 [Enterococcus cecorum]